MNSLNYDLEIIESVDELLALERSQKLGKTRDRIKFIRLLKSGICTSQEQAGVCIGLKRTQSQQIWRDYKQNGLSRLLQQASKRGFGKLTSHQLSQLRTRLGSHDIYTQGQLGDWLEAEMGVCYTQSGISYLLKRLKIKLKTGRPSHVHKDVAGAKEFKKTSLN